MVFCEIVILHLFFFLFPSLEPLDTDIISTSEVIPVKPSVDFHSALPTETEPQVIPDQYLIIIISSLINIIRTQIYGD